MATTRTFSMSDDVIDRLKHLSDTTGVSQAKVIESLLFLPDDQVIAQIEAQKEAIAQRKKARLQLKHDVMKKLAGMSEEEIAAFVKASKVD